MVALNEPFVSPVEPLKKGQGRDKVEFPLCSPVAVPARKHQVPNPVDIEGMACGPGNQAVGEKVVHVSKVIGFGIVNDNVLEAKETLAFLVPVQRIPA